MHTSRSGNVPRGQGARALEAASAAPLGTRPGAVPTRTRRGGTKVAAPTAIKTAATAPARTSGGTPAA